MATFDLQIYRPKLIFQYLAKQRKNVEYYLILMKKLRCFLELRVVKTTITLIKQDLNSSLLIKKQTNKNKTKQKYARTFLILE